jgi:DNA-3-methyladenine glycosylase II
MTPGYWQQASADLAQDDLILAGLVERFAGSALASRAAPPSRRCVRSIVGQQISVKAADSVWARCLAAALPEATPAGVLAQRTRKRCVPAVCPCTQGRVRA